LRRLVHQCRIVSAKWGCLPSILLVEQVNSRKNPLPLLDRWVSGNSLRRRGEGSKAMEIQAGEG